MNTYVNIINVVSGISIIYAYPTFRHNFLWMPNMARECGFTIYADFFFKWKYTVSTD